MKKILIYLITFWFFNSSSFAQIDTANQEMVSMADTYQKQKDGAFRYFKNGEEKPYDGVLFGKYENGNYLSIQEFKNGIGEGTWTNYYENGNLKEVGTYQKDKVAGPIQKFYPSGKLKAKGNYREWRIRVGEWIYYDEQGKIIKKENYGKKGDFRDVEDYYKRGEISKSWYEQILKN